MRATILSMVLVSAACTYAACSAAPIGEYPETDVELPERKEDAGSTNTGTDAGSGATFKLTVTIAGTGAGAVTSTPSGVTCVDKTCTGTFNAGTTVGLVPAPATGSTFTSWGGACSGNGVCTPVMNSDIAVTATMDTGNIGGTFSGMYSHTAMSGACTFNNKGTLTITVTPEGAGFANTANVTGLELRQSNNCALVTNMAVGNSPKEAITIAGATVTGTWTFSVSGASGNLALPYTATLAGNTLTGTWTCPTCTGNFTLNRQ